MKLRQLCLILLILCLHASVISADRGDDLISLVQSETLKAHIIALQENVQQVSPRGSEQPRASGTPQKERIVYRTRSSYHRDAADNATQYIANQFRRSPRLKVEFEKFSGMKNVIAKLPPRRGSASDRIFIVCAHYDTKANRDRGWNPLTSESPGADDNATGVAAMLEIAHLLSQFEYDHELRFIAFDGEEIGLMGSRHHAKKASRAGENIVVVINIDMIGFNWQTDLVEMLIKDSDEPSVWMSEVLLLANKWYHIGLEIRHTLDGSFEGSDHKPFWDNGYRAITFVESTKPWRDSPGYRANPFYHTSRDTVDKINMRLVRKVTQLALIGLNSLASQSPQAITSSPSITIDPLPVANQNPVHITGRFESVFPVDIIVVDPGPVRAQLDRSNHTYSAEVTIEVIPVNDAPTANAQPVTTQENTAVVITLRGSDVDGDLLTFRIAAPPARGTLSPLAQERRNNEATVTYTPNPKFTGSDGFRFRVNDGTVSSDPKEVSIEVTLSPDTTPPEVSAGEDAGAKNAPFTQEGTATDANGIASIIWSKVSGPGRVLFGASNARRTTVRVDTDGPYTIRLTVTDNAGNSSSDETTFTWDTAGPQVSAGGDAGVKNAPFAQTGNVTAPGEIASINWSQTSGPGRVIFIRENALRTTIAADTDGVYTIRLTVMDNAGNASSDETTFTWDVTRPDVNAGADAGTTNASFVQTGRATDANGIASAVWSQQSGPGNVGFGSRNQLATSVQASADGVYIIRLRVTDNATNARSATTTFTWDTTPPKVTHQPVTSGTLGGGVSIKIGVSDVSPPITGQLHYRPGGEPTFRQIPLAGTGTTLAAEIPTDAINFGVSYYVAVEDTLKNSGTHPEKGEFDPVGVVVSGELTQASAFPHETWHLFSVPFSAADADLTPFLDTAVGENSWVADTWNGTENVRTAPVATLGQPFWLITTQQFRSKLNGTVANPAESQTLPLRQGWNLVANPFPFPVSFGNIRVDAKEGLLPLDKQSAVRPRFWRWKDTSPNDKTDGAYEMITDFSAPWEPWSGYWVFADAAEATLRVEPFTNPLTATPSAPPQPSVD